MTTDEASATTHQLRRSLKQRHLTMIALGGVIGAGLFVGSGVAINAIGPGTFITYGLTGLLIVLVMRMLGEMAAAYPQTGSFAELCRMSLGNWAGFTVGWLYWYFWVIVVGFEAVAGAGVLQVWIKAPLWLLALILLLLLTLTNVASVRAYGEFEFWFASIKVFAIIAFLILGALYLIGLWPNSPHLSNLTAHGGFFPNGPLAVFSGIVIALFSMCGAEIATVAAAESDNPQRSVVRATNSVMIRVLLFYVGSMFLLTAILPWNSTELGQSPYVAALDRIGIPAVGTIMNAVVLTAVLSCLNSGIYTASRMVFALARRGDGPRWLLNVNRSGVPLQSILAATAIGYVTVALAFLFPKTIFQFLLNSSGAVMLFIYILISVAEMRMRPRLEREHPELLHVRMWLFPWLSRFAVVAMAAVLVAMYVRSDTRIQVVASFVSLAIVLAIAFIRYGRRAGVVADHPAGPARGAALEPTCALAAPATPVERSAPAEQPSGKPASRVLVVANETVGAAELLTELRQLADEHEAEYYVVVPVHLLEDGEGAMWDAQAPVVAAQRRLEATLDILRSEGLDADGAVGDYRPLHAMDQAAKTFHPDVIVISTHPQERSSWLKQNLVERAERHYQVPVRHVISRVPADIAE